MRAAISYSERSKSSLCGKREQLQLIGNTVSNVMKIDFAALNLPTRQVSSHGHGNTNKSFFNHLVLDTLGTY